MTNRVRAFLLPILFLVPVLGAWYYAYLKGPYPSYLFPSPTQVFWSAYHLAVDGQFGPNLVATLKRLFLGFLISLLIGVGLGFVMARFVYVREAIKPYLLGMQSLPSIAWVPVALLWFGFTESALLFVTIIGSLFAATLMFNDAIQSIPTRYIKAARNMGSDGVPLVFIVMIPAAMPQLLSGVKQTWAFAWRSLIGAEIIFAAVGLGFLLNQGREFFDVAQVFAVMVATLLIGLLFEVIVFSRLELRLAKRWGRVAT